MTMKKLICILTAMLLCLGLMCSCASNTDEELLVDLDLLSDYDYYTRFQGQDVVINVANWGEYMSLYDDELIDVNEAFEQLTGIEVNYTTAASNETLYSKIKSGGASYDIIIPSDYMISRMIKEDMLQKLDYSNIPNMANIMDNFLHPEYDPENEYSVPYLWGTVCIIYNTTMIDDEITSWSALFRTRF